VTVYITVSGTDLKKQEDSIRSGLVEVLNKSLKEDDGDNFLEIFGDTNLTVGDTAVKSTEPATYK